MRLTWDERERPCRTAAAARGGGVEGERCGFCLALLLAVSLLMPLAGCEPVGSGRAPAAAGGGVKVKLEVAACQPTSLPGLGDAILQVAARVAAMTAGRVELVVREPAALVPPMEVLDAVSTGQRR